MMQMTWQPLLPLWLTLPFVIGTMMLAVLHARRCSHMTMRWRIVLLGMRLTTIAVIACALLGPNTVDHVPVAQTDRPLLVVLLDASASMDTRDAHDNTRLNAAIEMLQSTDLLSSASQTHDVRMLVFGRSASVAGLDSLDDAGTLVDRRGTDLGAALDTARATVLQSKAGGAILLTSDGHDTTTRSPNPQADVSVFVVPVGSVNGPPDLDVQIAAMQQQLYVDEAGQARITVRQRGAAERSILVTTTAGNREAQHVATFDGEFASLDIPVRFDTTQSHEVVATVAPLKGETHTTNNSARTFIEVTDARTDVLIVEADPTWDTRFMAQSLARDPRLAITQVTQVGPDRQQITRTRSRVEGAVLPSDADAWAAYDVVILGGSLERALTATSAATLVDAVRERETRVIFTRVKAISPANVDDPTAKTLRQLSPLQHTTSASRTSSVTWPDPASDAISRASMLDAGLTHWPAELPPVVARDVTASASAQVLVRSLQGVPLVISHSVGNGRAMLLNATGLWQWAMRTPEEAHADRLLDALWAQLIHRAIGDQALGDAWSLRVEPARQRVDDSVVVQLRSRVRPLEADHMRVTVTHPDGQQHVLPWPAETANEREQAWQYQLRETGVYEFNARADGDATTTTRLSRVAAYDDNEELFDPRARPDVLRQIAQTTGGAVLAADQLDDLPAMLGSARGEVSATRQVARSLWTDSAALMLLLLWLGTEWIMRKQLGLS